MITPKTILNISNNTNFLFPSYPKKIEINPDIKEAPKI